MDTIQIIYLSGLLTSFIIGLWITFYDSKDYKDLLKGLLCTIIASVFSWLFVISVFIIFKPEFIDKFLNKRLPWKK